MTPHKSMVTISNKMVDAFLGTLTWILRGVSVWLDSVDLYFTVQIQRIIYSMLHKQMFQYFRFKGYLYHNILALIAFFLC